jgi:hypothetical protein
MKHTNSAEAILSATFNSKRRASCTSGFTGVGWRENPKGEIGPTYVPPNRESQSIVNIPGTELGDSSWQGEPCGHLTQALHHSEYGNASERISQEDRQGTGTSKGRPDSQEQTSTDCTTKSNKLDMS